jgi:hypothetical protein
MEKETRQQIEDFFAKIKAGEAIGTIEFESFCFDIWSAGRERGYEDGYEAGKEIDRSPY